MRTAWKAMSFGNSCQPYAENIFIHPNSIYSCNEWNLVQYPIDMCIQSCMSSTKVYGRWKIIWFISLELYEQNTISWLEEQNESIVACTYCMLSRIKLDTLFYNENEKYLLVYCKTFYILHDYHILPKHFYFTF